MRSRQLRRYRALEKLRRGERIIAILWSDPLSPGRRSNIAFDGVVETLTLARRRVVIVL